MEAELDKVRSLDRPTAICAAALLGVIAIAPFLLLPIIAEGATDLLHWSDARVGWLSAAILGGSACGAIGAGWWVRSVPWRRALAVTMIGGTASMGAASVFQSLIPLVVSLFASGVFGGSAYALSLTALSDGRNPDRGFGIAIALQVAFQVVGFLVGPALLSEGGMAGLFFVFGILNAVALSLLPIFPPAGRPVERLRTAPTLWRPETTMALLGLLLYFINVGAYWTYIERFGVATGMDPAVVARILAIGVATGAVGALAAAFLGDRYGRLGPIVVVSVATALAALLLLAPLSSTAFIASVVGYNVAWNAALAFQYAAVNAVDPTGRAVAIAPAFQSVGAAIGPAVAALLLSAHPLSAVPMLAAVCAAVSLLALALALHRGDPPVRRLRPASDAG